VFRPRARTAIAIVAAAALLASCARHAPARSGAPSPGLSAPAASALPGAAATPGATETTIDIRPGLVKRTYILDVPGGAAPAAGWPLVLLLHGGGGTAEGMANSTGGFPASAAARGFAVARPQGIDRQWNDGRPQVGAADDVAFLEAVVADVGTRVPLDPSRTYAAGISNGAMMTGRLACEPTMRLAAVAQVAGTIGVDEAPACDPGGPVSVLMLMGRQDPIVPYDGGPITLPIGEAGARGTVVGAEAYAASWLARLAAPTTSSEVTVAADASGQDVRGADGTELEFVTVDDGGHGWPGGQQYLPKLVVGTVVQTFSANQVILDFFGRHPGG
jgi:polyhydroxybutyrate depolymerase